MRVRDPPKCVPLLEHRIIHNVKISALRRNCKNTPCDECESQEDRNGKAALCFIGHRGTPYGSNNNKRQTGTSNVNGQQNNAKSGKCSNEIKK